MMKKLFILATVFCSIFMLNQSMAEETKSDKKNEASVSKASNPVVLKGVKKYYLVKNLQQDYIRKHYEGYRVKGSLISIPKNENDSFIQTFILEDDEGTKVQVSFDATDAYKARHRKGNEELEKLVKDMGGDRDSLTKEERKKIQERTELSKKLISEELKKSGKKFNELPKEEQKRILKMVDEANEKQS